MDEKSSLEMSGAIPSPENKKISSVDLMREKIFASWGTARDQFGVSNNYRLAEILYKSLYTPEEIKKEEIFGRPEFNRKEILEAKISLGSDIIPTEEEFISVVRRAMTRDAKFEKCLYDGALDFVKQLAGYGPITIWTSGDVYGIPHTKYRGSHEQLKRMAIAGLGDLRKKIAREKGFKNQDIIAVAARENKFELLKEVLKRYQERKISKVFIFDDRLKNLMRFIEECRDYKDFQFIPVWVRQGIYKETVPKESAKTIGQWADEFNAVDSVADAVRTLKEKGILYEKEKTPMGFIVDYDDVLSDDKKRKSEQIKSVLEMMLKKGWIKLVE